jgi:hypothetical protein
MEVGRMGTGKRKPGGSVTAGIAAVHFLIRPNNRQWVATGIVMLLAIGATLFAWQRWGRPGANSAEYEVTAEKISVTPQPAWIHGNVKTEVLRTAGSTRFNLLDRGLVQEVKEAFALHPWVAEVVRVEKRFPAQVIVELAYRRPALVVKLDTTDQGLLFLDEDGVLLPSSDFAPSQARNFLRILAAGETPTSIYGTRWSSERICGAARLAATWGDRWQPLGLYWIGAQRPAGSGFTFELRTQDEKVRVIWGSVDEAESIDEPTAARKIAALETYVHDKGPLDKSSSPAVIDLRELARQ